MKRSTRYLAGLATILVLICAVAVVMPLFFKDRIAERIKSEVNRRVSAQVDWQNLGLTFLRHFPNLTLSLDDLTVINRGPFQGDTLAAVRHFKVIVDLASAVGNLLSGGSHAILVRGVELDQPRLRLLKLEDGTANWDISQKPEAARAPAGTARPMAISLSRLDISDGRLVFDNRQSKLKASLAGYTQSLAGNVRRNLVTVKTKANADTVSITFAGIPYLSRVRLGLTADVLADLVRKSYTLNQTELRLNDLQLGISGSAQSLGKQLGLDLAFKAPNTKFRSILSLVPAVYAHSFEKVKTTGSFAVSGVVKGQYGDSSFPSFSLSAKVNDAAFQYPDLPLPARSIFMDLALDNPGRSADSTVLTLNRFHVLIGRNPIDARLELRTPLSDPNLDLRVKGKLDLTDVGRTFKLDSVDQLTGTLAADATVRTRMSYIDTKQFDKVAAGGSVEVGNLTVRGKILPLPLTIQRAALTVTPARAELKTFAGSIGSSDLQASGSLENLLGFALRDESLRGTATVRSNRFNLDEWRSADTTHLQIIPVPPRIEFGLDTKVAELTYDKLKMTDATGRLTIKDQRVTLENFRMNTLGGSIGVTGFYETTNPAKPTFDVAFGMTKVDIPSAFQAFTTVQMLAPVAKYAAGNVTTDVRLTGSLGKNMLPLFAGLTGHGKLQTSQVTLHDFPAMNRIVDLTKLQLLNNPTLQSVRTAFQINDGRLNVKPFAVKVGPAMLNVSGSNGLDQSLRYTLGLQIPRSLMGGAANQAVAQLVAQAGKAGVDLNAAPEIPLNFQLSGTVTNPAVKAEAGTLASSVTKGATEAVQQAAKKKVSAEAAQLVQRAQQQASEIRQQAQALADKVKSEGYRQADSLTQKAGGNPLLQAAAKPAADQLREQSDDKAADIVREAGQRADSVMAQAQRQADQITDQP
jgi:AsmA-like protein